MKKEIDGDKFIKVNSKGRQYIALPIDETILEVQECILKCIDKEGNKVELLMDKERFNDWRKKMKGEVGE